MTIGEESILAYFDSPKNRALWDKELESLDAERERRKEEGYRPKQAGRSAGSAAKTAGGRDRYADNPKVRRITLKELEEIERRASGRDVSGEKANERRRAKQAAMRRQKEKEQQAEQSVI